MNKKILYVVPLFYFGAVGYAALEILWRGYTHWTMALCGGTCMVLLWAVDNGLKERGLLSKSLAGCLIITVVELVAGCVVNLVLGLEVWDYSGVPGNIAGQICPPFTLVWFGVSFLVFSGLTLFKKLARLRYKSLTSTKNITITF